MGRPLNKKYFGNRNYGVTSPTDDQLGGEGVASVTLGTLGSYTTRPTITFPVPQIANGTRATGTVTSEVLSAITSNGTTGTGYQVGDLVTFTGITGVTGYVATVGSGVGEIQSITFTQAGTSRGNFTTLPSGVTNVAVVGGHGTLGTVNILFRAKAVAITLKGSGYTGSEAAPTFTQSVTGTTVLTTDSGAVGSTTNQENAIIAYAYISGSLVEVDIQKQISSKRYRVNKSGDTGAYERVGTRIARLRYDAEAGLANSNPYTAAEGVEMNIVAFDSEGKTYLVRKLTGRTCTLNPKAITRLSSSAGTQFAAGTQVKWSFSSAVLNTSVQIENA